MNLSTMSVKIQTTHTHPRTYSDCELSFAFSLNGEMIINHTLLVEALLLIRVEFDGELSHARGDDGNDTEEDESSSHR